MAEQKTVRDHAQALGGAALIVGSILLMLELLVRFSDPWGIGYFNDLLRMGNEYFVTDDTRGYVMRDGQYRFSDWRAEMDGGLRVIPDNNADADCTLALLGDSVTFAHGVNDDATWANQLAKNLPNVNFLNTGMTTYNSANALGSKQAFAADAYLYVIVYNDIEATLNPDPYAFPNQNPTNLPYIVRYVSFMMFGRQPSEFDEQSLPPDSDPNYQRFLSDVDTMMAEGDTWLIGFEQSPLNAVLRERGYDVQEYPYLEYQNSYVDNHWNRQGNEAFAELITPFVEDIVANACEDES